MPSTDKIFQHSRLKDWTYSIFWAVLVFFYNVFAYYNVYLFGDNEHRHFWMPMFLDVFLIILVTQLGGRLARIFGKPIDGWTASILIVFIDTLISKPIDIYTAYYFHMTCYGPFMMITSCLQPTTGNILSFMKASFLGNTLRFLLATALYLGLKFIVQKVAARKTEKSPT